MSMDDHEAAARRLRELFKGRLDQGTAIKLLEELGGELQAVDFVMNEEEAVVQQFLKKSPSYLRSLHDDAKRVDEILEHGIEFSVRQFACGSCVRSWWKKVPFRKEVSKCMRCKAKYQPVPKDNEWGWGKFVCFCENEFHGYGEMSVTTSDCYKCGMAVPIEKVLPPRKRIGQRKARSRTPHSCNAENCYNQSSGAHQPQQAFHFGPKDSMHFSKNGTYVQQFYNVDPLTGAQYFGPGPRGVPGQPSAAASAPAGASAGQNKRASGSSAGSNAPGAYPKNGSKPTCCHPKSAGNNSSFIKTASRVHRSSGSTVTTFLSQGSLDNRSDAVPRIPATIPE